MKHKKIIALLLCALLLPVFLSLPAAAAPEDDLFGFIDVDNGQPRENAAEGGTAGINIAFNGDNTDVVNIIILLTIMTLIPSILLMMTCFTRIVIVFSFIRNALGLQQTPPNQVLIGIALFVSLFVMSPVIKQVNEVAYKPYSDGQIQTREFVDRASVPIKDFMLRQTKTEDLSLFMNLSGREMPEDTMELGLDVCIPAFVTSELKRAFTMGFLIFIPFLVIDMIVSSTLMSMGMMMLPPVTISLPFKIMLFVLVDGWGLIIKTLVMTYY